MFLSASLTKGNRYIFPQGYKGRGVKLTTHPHLKPRLRIVKLNLHSHIPFNGMVSI
jgi:hypothetical protein